MLDTLPARLAALAVAVTLHLAGGPARADAPDACRVAVGPGPRTACADGAPGRCECLRLVNGCPYGVVAYVLVDGTRRSVPMDAASVDEGSACSTDARGDATGIGWHPREGHPGPGQPLPSP